VPELTAEALGVRGKYPLVGAVGKRPLLIVVGKMVEPPLPGDPVRAVDPHAEYPVLSVLKLRSSNVLVAAFKFCGRNDRNANKAKENRI
jgi:hypothetical protein